jgi:hypothetical protein
MFVLCCEGFRGRSEGDEEEGGHALWVKCVTWSLIEELSRHSIGVWKSYLDNIRLSIPEPTRPVPTKPSTPHPSLPYQTRNKPIQHGQHPRKALQQRSDDDTRDMPPEVKDGWREIVALVWHLFRQKVLLDSSLHIDGVPPYVL